MNGQYLELAKNMAKLPYSVTRSRDEATDGTPILLVENDELKGCMAQGKTIEEALANLEEARVDYIYSLLEDGLEIPLPEQSNTVTVGGNDDFQDSVTMSSNPPSFLENLEQVSEKETRAAPVRVVLQT